MPKIWLDHKGQAWEIKIEKGKYWHRRQAEGDDKWRNGTPPGWTEKAKIPLDQRSGDS